MPPKTVPPPPPITPNGSFSKPRKPKAKLPKAPPPFKPPTFTKNSNKPSQATDAMNKVSEESNTAILSSQNHMKSFAPPPPPPTQAAIIAAHEKTVVRNANKLGQETIKKDAKPSPPPLSVQAREMGVNNEQKSTAATFSREENFFKNMKEQKKAEAAAQAKERRDKLAAMDDDEREQFLQREADAAALEHVVEQVLLAPLEDHLQLLLLAMARRPHHLHEHAADLGHCDIRLFVGAFQHRLESSVMAAAPLELVQVLL